MKRHSLRIGVLVLFVVLGIIAYAYAQRGAGDKSAAADISAENMLRVGNMQTIYSTEPGINPLRDDQDTADHASVEKTAVDPRISRISAELPATRHSSSPPVADPFGLSAHPDRSSADHTIQQTASNDDIPDASSLEAFTTTDNGEQARNPQLVGPGLGNPASNKQISDNRDLENKINAPPANQNCSSLPMVERYPGKESDRYSDKYSDSVKNPDRYRNQSSAQSLNKSNHQEPGRFKADPASSPTAIVQDADSPPDRFLESDKSGAAENSSTMEGSGRPGANQLDGPQTPQVTIQKLAPREIQVGKPAVFKITVRNTGSITASQVEIHDQVPKGTKLLGATPRASQGAQGEIVWPLGALRPGEEASVEIELMPTAEGEIGSVATVHIGAEASARTISTRPKLVLETSAPDNVLLGEQMTLSIIVSNPGTGVATGVVLEEHIPAGLQHPAGPDLEYEVGDLRPGENKKLDLPLAAVTAGAVVNVLTARADGNLRTEDRLELQVVAPKLDLATEGPKRRYLEREATYQVSISNPGTAPAKQVELAAYLPPGLKFVSANNSGQYDEVNRTVYWLLEELPAHKTGSVELVALPIQAGQHSIKLRGTAQRGLVAEKEQSVIVEGIAAILFQAVDLNDPIEVGGETTYEVHVVNQGSKASSNLRLAVLLPPELKPLAAEGPTRYSIDGNRVQFEGLAGLAPKADTTYRLRVKALRPGDLRTRFQLLTDEMQSPVTKEESTQVYADE